MLGVRMTKGLFARGGLLSSLRAGDSRKSTGQFASSEIRPATLEDCDAILDIYNFYVTESLISFEEEPTDIKYWHEKFKLLNELGLPFLVAVSNSSELLGFAYLAPWRQKSAYRSTAENSIYLKKSAIGKGLGPQLLGELLRLGKQAGIKEVVAVISDSGAETSIEMHKKFGFKKMGHLPRVGFKLNNWLGVNLMQKSL
jgi:L-amino acid N-acyltransferase YncA